MFVLMIRATISEVSHHERRQGHGRPRRDLSSFQEVMDSTCTYKDTYSCGSLHIASARVQGK